MSIVEQAVWAEAAASLLFHCIRMPFLGITDEEDVRKRILPHVEHVRECQNSIEQRMRYKRMTRMKPWPAAESRFDGNRVLTYVKFSLVYSQNGRWEETKRLQLAVKTVSMQRLGLEHQTTRGLMLLLSQTQYHLGQSDDSAALGKQILHACTENLGVNHYQTLSA
jgi:hypothetical protein